MTKTKLEAMMRQHRWLAATLGVGLLFTTAASTTYAEVNNQQDSYGHGGFLCNWFPRLPWCTNTGGNNGGNGGNGGNNGGPSVAATPELDSLLLFGFGLTGLGGYSVTRWRARRRP
jgi:hypothetical protein